MPGRLEEMYAALGNDPLRIHECLARPILVGRLARIVPPHDIGQEAADILGLDSESLRLREYPRAEDRRPVGDPSNTLGRALHVPKTDGTICLARGSYGRLERPVRA